MGLERGPLLADETLSGRAWCRAHSDLVDEWLAELLHRAGGTTTSGIALVAVGGYGRAELCPQSDIDVMLVHDRRLDVTAIAERVWYPVWDQELHLGHSVCTVRDALALGADDLDTATSLLSARLVAGDPGPAANLAAGASGRWRKRSPQVLWQIADRVEQRHEKAGDVAFRPEPDLKEGRGGLRDVHALRWAEAAQGILVDEDTAVLDEAYATLLEARVELQRLTGRPANVLAVEHQPAVASALGLSGAEALMARIAEAARAIAWTSDDAWRRLAVSPSGFRGPASRGRGSRGRSRGALPPGDGLHLSNAEVSVDDDVDAADPVLVLRAAATAARHGAVIERRSLERLAAAATPWLGSWSDEARAELIELLGAGPLAIRVIEGLDRRGVWGCVLPEWRSVRSRPQPGSLHDFTVDRHLLETVAAASRLTSHVSRQDLLLMAAMLHDIGKGSGADHAAAGARIAEHICERMGFVSEDVGIIAWLVEQHLLLRDVAARRDIDDLATTQQVANQIGSVGRLRLLAALTEADGLATSATAWDPWTSHLIARLVERVEHLLHGSGADGRTVAAFPTEEQLTRLMDGERRIEVAGDVVTVMTADRPGVFSRVAGVLALHGLDVLAASAYSARGRALAEFRVTDAFRDETPWPRVTADLELALDGRLALQARLSERVRTYARRRHAIAGPAPTVSFDDRASEDATVIDVQAADAIGVLYRITQALAELDLDIRSARVQTLGERVHDAFYVRDRGGKITDPRTLAEIERAILHGLAE
jgi:[protein-PII] uridylyltransferase